MLTIDVVITYLFLASLPLGLELNNCMHPYYEGDHENIGLM